MLTLTHPFSILVLPLPSNNTLSMIPLSLCRVLTVKNVHQIQELLLHHGMNHLPGMIIHLKSLTIPDSVKHFSMLTEPECPPPNEIFYNVSPLIVNHNLLFVPINLPSFNEAHRSIAILILISTLLGYKSIIIAPTLINGSATQIQKSYQFRRLLSQMFYIML